MTAIKVRPVSVAKLPKLKKMFQRALHEDFAYFPGEYIEKVSRDNSTWNFLRAKLNPNRIVLGLFDDNSLIGYAIADTSLATDSDIFWFYIVPERRGQGLGKSFFQELLGEMERAGTKHVYLITHNQRDFYERFDFSTQEENSELFDGITMYEMSKDLS